MAIDICPSCPLSNRVNKLNLKTIDSKYRNFCVLFCISDVSGRQNELQRPCQSISAMIDGHLCEHRVNFCRADVVFFICHTFKEDFQWDDKRKTIHGDISVL